MTLRVIHVGLGGRGGHWLDYLKERTDIVPAAFVDASAAILGQVKARPGYEGGLFFERLDEALRAVQADFVLIATPSFLHAPQALEALDAGLAVLVEKPLGLTLQEATAVMRRAHAAGRPVVVAENYRFFQAERTLRAFLQSGAAGRITSAVCIDRRDQSSRTQGSWVKSMPYPFLTEIGVHHFDSFRYLFGSQPASVRAMSFNPPGSDYDHEGGAHALLELEDGPGIQYSGAFVGSRYEYALFIEAENGDVRTDRIRVWWRPRGERSFRELPPQPLPAGEVLRYPRAGMATLLSQFIGVLQGRGTAETRGEDNLWTLAMLEAAVLSVREGRKVAISEVYPPSMRVDGGAAPGA
jgi:predicted dehydrogenase